MRLLKAFLANDARKLQVGFGLVFRHVVFERRALATLEAAHFASRVDIKKGKSTLKNVARLRRRHFQKGPALCYLLQRLGSCVPQLVDKQVFPLFEGLAALIAYVVPLLCKRTDGEFMVGPRRA